jgi:homoserine acetyltransferase
MRPRAASRWHHPALQPGWIDRPHQTLELGDLPLESGEVIRDFGISYVTHGTRPPADDNVILVLTAIGSTHHRLDFLIGLDRPLDPDRHFIICAGTPGWLRRSCGCGRQLATTGRRSRRHQRIPDQSCVLNHAEMRSAPADGSS